MRAGSAGDRRANYIALAVQSRLEVVARGRRRINGRIQANDNTLFSRLTMRAGVVQYPTAVYGL